MKQSAGILLFRKVENNLEFFLVHPGGPFFVRKDEGFWTIPKGELMEGENPFDAAQREFEEEIGIKPEGNFIQLNPIIQKGGKKVLCWALEMDCDPAKIISNTFEIEWPPRSGKRQSFPEVDRASWFVYEEAIKFINEKQIALLNELKELIKDF
ncbi:NUDIX domain-containing protein [Pedobacter fastidiosus]|uniref:NUDIX domain-containing protein n=1 Tax=Pedobacter fastidiosus TaxID=2765361 RepID=A0ABR7KYB2_9SPHI|nr:NUDIX domain-containing protein [Pedobacter fastidiosus]MBC6113114.1 NUDIX domain-containing protein [Pedobacter fastidiosus]